MTDITMTAVHGQDVLPYVDDLARLRIEVFRAYPYLYDGTMDYERKYLRNYCRSPESIFVLARDGDEVVGVSTGVPMEDETEEFKRPFIACALDPAHIFYFGESVLKEKYRGRGIGVCFMEERERYAQALGRFTHTAFCAVDRPADHHRRPSDYVPLDAFWTKRGYEKQPDLRTTYSWRDLDEDRESDKPMTFWMKRIA